MPRHGHVFCLASQAGIGQTARGGFMKEHLKALAAIREDLALAVALPARGSGKVDALLRSVGSICSVVEALVAPPPVERHPISPRPQIEPVMAIGETQRSSNGFWFRVTRVRIGEAVRVRVELMRSVGGEEHAVRSMDSTDHACRELGEILAKL